MHTCHETDPKHARIQKIPSGAVLTMFFYSTTYFIDSDTDLPLETIGPFGSNCFSRGVRTSISKETYSHL